VLGLVASDTERLRKALLRAAVAEDAVLTETDEYGRTLSDGFQVDQRKSKGSRQNQLDRAAW